LVSVKVCPEDEIATKGGGINAMNHAL